MSENLAPMFWDPNPNDWLAFTMPAQDIKEMGARGLMFEVQNGVPRIVGRPTVPGVIGSVKIRATDPHGAWTEAYITIKIIDYRVIRRDDRKLKDFLVIETRRF
jgi:hypothetical protein